MNAKPTLYASATIFQIQVNFPRKTYLDLELLMVTHESQFSGIKYSATTSGVLSSVDIECQIMGILFHLRDDNRVNAYR